MTNKKFNIVNEGYDINEVNKFLKVVTAEFEKLVSTNADLEVTIKELNEKIRTYEERVNSVELYKEELDSFIDAKRAEKISLENQINILESKLEEYNNVLNTIFYEHVELINKLK